MCPLLLTDVTISDGFQKSLGMKKQIRRHARCADGLFKTVSSKRCTRPQGSNPKGYPNEVEGSMNAASIRGNFGIPVKWNSFTGIPKFPKGISKFKISLERCMDLFRSILTPLFWLIVHFAKTSQENENERFEKLCAILSPRENHFVDGWLVLSVPAKRALFGEELEMNPKFRSGSGLKVGMDSWTPFSPLVGLGAFAKTRARNENERKGDGDHIKWR
nr:uncharacterized protein LOC109173489 [Ipomoea batatas]